MAQFDVYRNPVTSSDDGFPYVLVIQSDLLEHLNLRIVVPLVRADVVDPPLPRLNPRFRVADESVVMATTLIGGLPAEASAIRSATSLTSELISSARSTC
jgi:toxin CcdB